ncbi:putative reverse transcriptase/RNA-dependent DNA polymerase [Citrus sinensis]|uniref:Reverse transcriptase/RNA-dependent DNA polymerase n=1 Tax=Citrus sinensis TaxID=2711 RepID=A0ACB8LT57_CITSI|nr:putative reverse transcriptase/RNA-dependent DNA polymerase [Citrus sinensis]
MGGGGKSEEKAESSENHSSSQQQRQKQVNPSRVNGSEPIGAEMGQIREHDKRSGVEGVGEQHLMKEMIESMEKKQVDGYKQAEGSGNGTIPRKEELEAGKGNIKEREMGQVNRMRREEADIDDGLVSVLQMNGIANKLHFDNCFAVNCSGRGGGLALLWSSGSMVQIKSFSTHHIDAEILTTSGRRMRITGVYGHPEMGQKKHTWTLLRRLAGLSFNSWLCFGDFNEVLHPGEKRGGNDRNVKLINDFSEALRDCDLKDVGFKGYPFTWSNGRYGQGFVEERLDKFVCNKKWSEIFVDGEVSNLDTWFSDHCPVLMEVHERNEGMIHDGRHRSRIHYEDMWSSYDECKEIIKEEWRLFGNWRSENPVQVFRNSAKKSMARLLYWSKGEFRRWEKKLEELRVQLQGLKLRKVQFENGVEIKKVEKQIQNILIEEEIYWKQCSRADWLKEGDKNTKFFHNKASSRKKKNIIWGIEDTSGRWTEKPKEIEQEFCSYFNNLFATTQPSQEQISAAIEGMTSRVSEDMNEMLEKPFSAEEVMDALSQMCPTKAPIADCQKLKMILDCYSMASGQIFNFEKSSIFLSGNVQQAQATAIGNIFHLNIVSRHENYLGLPAMVGRKRSGFFNDIKLKVLNKISSWQHKFFSCGGKEVLIKAAVQAIPAFAMSVFKIPLGICEDIQRIVANFWWGSSRERRSIHWSKWEKMSQAKCKGLGSNPSYIWRSILWGRQIICAGSRWRIGNGQDVHIHKANWIPKPFTFKHVIKPTMPSEALVSELINGENCWDEELIYRHFDKMDADVITQIPLPRRSREDELIWHYGTSGQYTVKSGYQTALKIRFPAMPSSSESSKNEWNIIWSLALPKKIIIFVWRAAKNLLSSAENLWKRKIVQEPTCQLCKMGIENVVHALVDCKAAKKVWRLSLFVNDIQAAPGQDILSLLHGVKRMRSNADVDLFVAILWAKWNARNQWLFKGKRENPQSVVAKAEAVMEAFKRMQPSADVSHGKQQKVAQLGWNPPQKGFVKINTDAATNSEKNLVGLEAVIRDETGQVTAAAIKVSKFHGSVAYAEAKAMEWGLQVAKDTHVKDVIMESDSQEVVSLVNNR